MSRIEFKKKPRKDPGSALWTTEDGSQVFIGRDYALQNEIDEKIAERNARSCFRGCNTCGACANSKRDNVNRQVFTREDGLAIVKGPGVSYDSNKHQWVNCRECEPFRFHDCHNGVMRDTHQDAEPFTQDQLDLIKLAEDGRPLI